MRFRFLLFVISLFLSVSVFASETKLTASDAFNDARFGYSVAVSGNDMIVGAENDVQGNRTGSAYIFTLSGGAWSQVAKLTPSDGVEFDGFGASVAIDGDYAVVGAPDDDDAGNSSGSAYVFYRDQGGANNWGEVAKLTASDAAAGDRFGDEFSVGISGDYIVIGARRVDSTFSDMGAAYIFERPPTGWTDATEDTQLVADDSAQGDNFGLGVAIDSNKVLIGAARDDAARGSVYFYYRDVNGVWNERQKFTATSQIVDGEFGKTIAIDSNYAVIGSPHTGGTTPDSGFAYIFELGVDTLWSQQAILLPHDRRSYNHFGNAVAIDSNMVLIGAWADSSVYGIDAGVAYTFLRTGSTWQEVNQFIASDGDIDNRFGFSVALHNDYALIGASRHDLSGVAGTNHGAVYSHKIDLFVDIALWLEGPYSTGGDTMSTAINDSIPLNNPYSASPWNYAGGDSIGVIRDTIVDWVLVELRTGTDGSTAVDSCAAFVTKSGKIVGISGSGALPLDVSAGNYYIVVRHRNHLAVMTANAVTLSSRSLNSYDFTTGTGQYFGGDAKQLETGVFGMYKGDANGNAFVNSADYLKVKGEVGSNGYYGGDCNLNGFVNSADYLSVKPNVGTSSQVP